MSICSRKRGRLAHCAKLLPSSNLSTEILDFRWIYANQTNVSSSEKKNLQKLDDALRDTGETGEIGETGTGIRGPRKPKKTTKSNRPQGCWHRPVNYSRTFELISHFNIFNILHIFTLTVCKTSALGPYLLSGCNKAERFLFFLLCRLFWGKHVSQHFQLGQFNVNFKKDIEQWKASENINFYVDILLTIAWKLGK